MNVVRWSPFRELDNLLQAFDRPVAPVRRADWLPLVDIHETQHDYQIAVEVPAVAADDLAVSVNDNVLTVSGERKAIKRFDGSIPAASAELEAGTEVEEQHDHTPGGEKVHRVERRFGRFVRNFQLPEDADHEAISAERKDGVLYLSIAKRASATPRQIDIK